MTDTLKEQLSAFLDGELPEAETTLLLKRLERDEDLKSTLSRYSLIGAVLRTDGDVPAARHVASRVSAALAREPALVLPRRQRWLQPAAGLALAASVAAAAVLLVPQMLAGVDDETPVRVAAELDGPPAAAVPDSPGGKVALPVVVAADDQPAVPYTTPPLPSVPVSSTLPSTQLASYLVAHSEYTLPLTRRSLLTTVPGPTDATGGSEAQQAGR